MSYTIPQEEFGETSPGYSAPKGVGVVNLISSGLNALPSIIGLFGNKNQTQQYAPPPPPPSNNLLLMGAGAVVLIILVLLITRKR